MTVPLEAAAKKQGEDLKIVRRLFAPLSVFSMCLKVKHTGVVQSMKSTTYQYTWCFISSLRNCGTPVKSI